MEINYEKIITTMKCERVTSLAKFQVFETNSFLQYIVVIDQHASNL